MELGLAGSSSLVGRGGELSTRLNKLLHSTQSSAQYGCTDLADSLRRAVLFQISRTITFVPRTLSALHSKVDQSGVAKIRKNGKSIMKTAGSLEEWRMGSRTVHLMHELNRHASDMLERDELEAKIELMKEVMAVPDVSVSDLTVVAHCVLRDGLGMIKKFTTYEHTSLEIPIPPLVAEFVSTATTLCEMISTVAAERWDEDVTGQMLENLNLAKQGFGKTGLFLSGGATFGMAHIGVVKALFEHGTLPNVITGASAGSIIAAMVCTRTDEEIPGLLATFHTGNLAVFGPEDGEWLSEKVHRLITTGYWLDAGYLKEGMEAMLGDMTFAEAYRRTRRVCNISVSYEMMYEEDHLLNFMTAPHVTIASAVTASCALPFVFKPGPLLWRNPETGNIETWKDATEVFVDGSIHADLPMRMVRQYFNVRDYIVSQANLHINMFGEEDWEMDESEKAVLAQSEANGIERDHWSIRLAEQPAILGTSLSTLLTKVASVFLQKYSGNVTMRPMMPLEAIHGILKNPDPDFMKMACLVGERAAWPKIERIKASVAIERALEGCLQALKVKHKFHEVVAIKRRQEMFLGTENRHRRHSGGAIDLGRDVLRPLTTANLNGEVQHEVRPSLKRSAHSQQFPVVQGISAIPSRRPRGRMLPPLSVITQARPGLQHPGQFKTVDLSIPLSPAESLSSSSVDRGAGDRGSATTEESDMGQEDNEDDDDDEDDYVYLRAQGSRDRQTRIKDSKSNGSDC